MIAVALDRQIKTIAAVKSCRLRPKRAGRCFNAELSAIIRRFLGLKGGKSLDDIAGDIGFGFQRELGDGSVGVNKGNAVCVHTEACAAVFKRI